MRRILTLIAILVFIALVGLAGAGVRELLDNEKIESPGAAEAPADARQPDDNPRLTREDAVNLIRTHMSTNQEISRTCLLIFASTGQSTTLLRDLTASYAGDGLWIVSNELCTFALSDHTGKVTGP